MKTDPTKPLTSRFCRLCQYEHFSVLDGLVLQAKHLAHWCHILKPNIYKQLATAVARYNAASRPHCGHDVARGDSLTEWVANYPKQVDITGLAP